MHIDGSAYIDDFAQSLLPHATDIYDIGSATFRFNDIHAKTLTVDSIIGAGVTESDTLQTVTTRGATTTTSMTSSATITAEQLTSTDDASVSDVLTVGTLTDGVLSINVGTISGATNGTFTGVVTAEHIASTDDMEVADTLSINGTMTISSGSITDSTGNLNLGTSNVTVGGDLTVGGNINLTGVSAGHIRPTTDIVYELGAGNKRYSNLYARNHYYDSDSGWVFDGNYASLYINGVLYKRYGTASAVENIVFGGENVIYSAEQVVY